MKEIKLRDYQEECVSLIDSLDKGSYLVVMATGLGKTAVFSHIKRRGRVLILSHREELVHQPEQYYPCTFGVERAEETSNGEEVISASVQTLIHRLDKFKPDEFDTLITDEAHHAVAPSYRKIYRYFKPRLHLGFTATPNRADSVRLGEIYSKVIFERNIRWGIKNGYLSDIRCLQAQIGYDLRGVRTQMGDFNQGDLEQAVDIKEVNEAIARVYREKAIGPTLIFATSVDHANNLAALIDGARVITAETPDRADILAKFASGEVKVIVNCMVLTEGTDLPMVRTVIMCRPTRNVSLFTQVVGRGLRLYEGKKELLLIDCAGTSDLPLCTAPVLFGLDPEKTRHVAKDGKLLTEIEREVKEEERKEAYKGAWKINLKLIQMFEEDGGYDTKDVNYVICANGSMVCSIGDGKRITVAPEDLTGHTSVTMTEYGKVTAMAEDVQMQTALDIVYEQLCRDYPDKSALWDRGICSIWGKAPASDKQKDFIRKLYTDEDLKDVSFRTLNKYEASCLINSALERDHGKESTGKGTPSGGKHAWREAPAGEHAPAAKKPKRGNAYGRNKAGCPVSG